MSDIAHGSGAWRKDRSTNSRPQLLAGQGTVIFGGGRGIGRATALALGAAGGAVAVVDLEAGRAQATVDELRDLGAAAQAFPADVRSADDRAAVPIMLAPGRGGSIVSVGSISGAVSAPHHVPYGVAKAGQALVVDGGVVAMVMHRAATLPVTGLRRV